MSRLIERLAWCFCATVFAFLGGKTLAHGLAEGVARNAMLTEVVTGFVLLALACGAIVVGAGERRLD